MFANLKFQRPIDHNLIDFLLITYKLGEKNIIFLNNYSRGAFLNKTLYKPESGYHIFNDLMAGDQNMSYVDSILAK